MIRSRLNFIRLLVGAIVSAVPLSACHFRFDPMDPGSSATVFPADARPVPIVVAIPSQTPASTEPFTQTSASAPILSLRPTSTPTPTKSGDNVLLINAVSPGDSLRVLSDIALPHYSDSNSTETIVYLFENGQLIVYGEYFSMKSDMAARLNRGESFCTIDLSPTTDDHVLSAASLLPAALVQHQMTIDRTLGRTAIFLSSSYNPVIISGTPIKAVECYDGTNGDLQSQFATVGDFQASFNNQLQIVKGSPTPTPTSTSSPGVPTLSYAAPSMNGFVGSPMSVAPSTLNTNGAAIIACGIQNGTASLPSYLSIDPQTCVISGTPISTLAATTYEVVATNSVGASLPARVIISVFPMDKSTIETVAGKGASGYSGDGGPALEADLSLSIYEGGSTVVDPSGTIYFVDQGNNRIRKVTPDGTISTIAGNGIYGYSGDGGPAIAAKLWQPYDIAIDSNSNLYIADRVNGRIRKVTPDGIISTVAGNGSGVYNGDGGLATSAGLSNPVGVAVDANGNLYVADSFHSRIRKVTPDGIISTVAGNGTSGYSGDGGLATSAELGNPIRVAVDLHGNLYIVDSGRIRKVTPDGIISTVAGNGTWGYSGDGGPATSAQLNSPDSITVDSDGNLYIADAYNNRIRKVMPNGIIWTVAGNGTAGYSGDGGHATSAELKSPSGVAIGSSGDLYIGDAGNNVIRRVVP